MSISVKMIQEICLLIILMSFLLIAYTLIFQRKNDSTYYKFTSEDRIFPSYISCQNLLDDLCDLLDKKGYVTVWEYKNLIGAEVNEIDREYGWTNIFPVPLKKVKNGYIIMMPTPKPIALVA